MKKIIWFVSIIIIVGLGLYLKVYLTATKPVNAAEEKAVEIAKKTVDLKDIEDFHLYNSEETIYVIEARNKKDENIIIWIPEKKGKTIVKKAKDGLSKKDAINKLIENGNPQKILSVQLGMEKNLPLWEIYYLSENNLINYYYVHFETGERLKQIENL